MRPIEPFIKDNLNTILGVPVKLIIKLVLIALVFSLFQRCSEKARHQYSPVVQKICIDDANWHNADWIDVYAALDDSLDSSIGGAIKGNQFIDVYANIIQLSEEPFSVPSEVSEMTQDSIAHYFTLSISSSGDDFRAGYEKINEWQVNAGGYSGITRVSELENGHKYLLENYSQHGISQANIMIRGNSIFTDKDPNNPFIAFTLTFEDGISLRRKDSKEGMLLFHYNKLPKDNNSIPYSSPIRMISVFPEPDYITPTSIKFSENFNQILEHGLYIIAEDISKKKKNDVDTFLNSVYMGLLISWLIQLLVGIIKDFSLWLNYRSKKSLDEN